MKKNGNSLLVIHPDDESTRVLSVIYADLKDAVVVTKEKSRAELHALAKDANVVFCLGHGTNLGLLAVGQFGDKVEHCVESSFVPAFKSKRTRGLLFIWCNADAWVAGFPKLRRVFFSGMFVSDAEEAYIASLPMDNALIEQSNVSFCEIVRKHIGLLCVGDIADFHARVVAEYREIAKNNPIASFNCDRLYFRK